MGGEQNSPYFSASSFRETCHPKRDWGEQIWALYIVEQQYLWRKREKVLQSKWTVTVKCLPDEQLSSNHRVQFNEYIPEFNLLTNKLDPYIGEHA